MATTYVPIAGLAVFISDKVIYSSQGGMASITASYVEGLRVQWYFQDTLINTTNPRYSISTENGEFSTLRIVNVDADVLGTYQAVVTVKESGHTASDFTQLKLTGNDTEVDMKGEGILS